MIFSKKNEILANDYQVVNELKALALDMIDNAGSGHPGICLDAAPILYTLVSRHLNFNRKDSKWYNRDRLILSAGHVVPLVYAMMYMLDMLSLDDIKNLRRYQSITPGHPEIKTPFMECTTGPLGEGIATSLGIAIAERYLNKRVNSKMIDYYTYVFLGEGDLMEGITYEALSLIGHLKLKKMILLFDSNKITLDGNLNASFSEDIVLRMKSMHFNVLTCNGEDLNDIDRCLSKAKKSDKPTFIICNTIIGKNSFHENTNLVHGQPLALEDIKNIKKCLNLPDYTFNVTINSTNYFKDLVDSRMFLIIKDYQRNYDNLKEKEQLALNKLIYCKNTFLFEDLDIVYENKTLLEINHDLLNYVNQRFDLLIGGSADVASSTKVFLDQETPFTYNNYRGKIINYGVREQVMGAVMNGLALANLRPFGACFLTFSNYLINSIRMSAIMNLPVIYYFTHDGISSPENGVCHVPVEQLLIIESIPNLFVYRPYDVNELIACYKEIFAKKRPAAIVLSKDNQEVSPLTKSNRLCDGAYILRKEETNHFITLVANGEEVGLMIKVADELKTMGIDTRLVSIPCMKNYLMHPFSINDNHLLIAITYGLKNYYYHLTKNVIGLDGYVYGGNKQEVQENCSLTVEQVKEQILTIIEKSDYDEK